MESSDRVEIDWLPATRTSELHSFLDAEWKAGHVLATNERLLRWQHRRGDDELSFVAASMGGELVGVLGVIPADVGVCGERFRGGWLTTWVVVAAARRHRIGLRLLEFVLERHPFVGTIGGNATTQTILSALRFHTTPAVPRWVRPLDAGALAGLTGNAVPAVAPVRLDDDRAGLEWSDDVAARWTATWQDLSRDIVGTWRDADYLRWRYVDHPVFDYRIRFAPEGDRISALLVSRIEQVRDRPESVIRVVEALGEVNPLAELARELVAEGAEAGVAFADFYCTTDRYAPALVEAGFVPESSVDESFPSRLQPLEPGSRPLTAAFRLRPEGGESDALEASDRYFTRSDCDQDRPS